MDAGLRSKSGIPETHGPLLVGALQFAMLLSAACMKNSQVKKTHRGASGTISLAHEKPPKR